MNKKHMMNDHLNNKWFYKTRPINSIYSLSDGEIDGDIISRIQTDTKLLTKVGISQRNIFYCNRHLTSDNLHPVNYTS
ncbi:hypothetical protein KFK09_019107 [Dendrobium nobile]|uniref:Uncharacterized protein n=1 Tax=Dendrobium nobile TaxID=94219 RepID=A0A8T3AX45_DENNO|nr:hypothetical protein KFK09_019107 [Dendrobium nobile]